MPEHAPFNPEQFLAELEPVFQRPHDDADRLLHSPSIYERTGVLQTPLVTEDHLLRRLKSIYTGDGSGFAQDEAKAILDSPAAGDRLRGYALFAKKGPGFASNANRVIHQIKDPRILDGIVDRVNDTNHDWDDGGMPGYALRDALRELGKNPLLTAEHERKLLFGEEGSQFVEHARNPDVVNDYARHLLQMFREDKSSIDARYGNKRIVKNPNLDPDLLVEFGQHPEYLTYDSWVDAVATRHPNPGKALSSVLKRPEMQAVTNALIKATAENPKLANDKEWVSNLLQNKGTQEAAIQSGLGSKEDIQNLANTTTNDYILRQLAARKHPHADNEMVRAILDREYPNPMYRKSLASYALEGNNNHGLLDDETALKAIKTAELYSVVSILTHRNVKLSANVINSLVDEPQLRDAIASNPQLTPANQMKLAQERRRHRHALAKNPALHPDAIKELIKPDPEDMERGLFVPKLMSHPNFNEEHHEQLKAQGDFDRDFRIHDTHLRNTSNLQSLRDAFEQAKQHPPTVSGEYGPDVSLFKGIFENTKVELPDDMVLHGARHPNSYVYGNALKHLKQHHFDHVIDIHPTEVARKTSDPRHLDRLVRHKDERVRESAYDNRNVTVEQLSAALNYLEIHHPNPSPQEQAKLRKRIKEHDPDTAFNERVGVRFGTGKLRQIRDLLEERGVQEVKLKDLPSRLADFVKASKAGINPKNGNVNLDLLKQHIENLPASKFNISHDAWSGIQRHNRENSKVFQLNITTDHVKQMKDAGVYDTFRKLQDMFKGHPISDTTFGWVRWTGKPGTNPGDGVFVDETQSDHTVPLAEKVSATTYKSARKRGESEETAKAMAKDAFDRQNEQTPAEHQKKINQILFGKRHSSEVLLEAFHQHLRDKGHAGTKIAIHSIHSKAPISLGNVRRDSEGKVNKKDLPGHFVEGYDNVPKSMGMEPSQYHKDNMATQDSEALQGVATHQDTLRKKEQEWQAEAAIFSQWVAMVKAQQPGYGDDIDDEFGPEVEVRMPEFAVWAEHSKRKSD